MSQAAAQKNVLLIEDDPHWQFIVGESIRSIDENIHIHCVRTAQHAEEILFKNETEDLYDLIISDHHLADATTELDLWKKFQIQRNQIPFMTLSGLSNDEYLKMVATEKNYPLFLQKDLIPEKLKSLWDTESVVKQVPKENPALQFVAVALMSAGAFFIPALLICAYVTS